jgi:ribosomal protein S2
MKITKLNKHRTKLLKLKLLKTKIYKNQTNFNYMLLKDIEARLKKALHVIFRFHVANKKILFIGTPIKLNSQIKQLLKDKKHSFIPELIWMNGIVTNSNPSFKHLLKRHAIDSDQTSKFLFNLKNQTDLIVVLNEKLNLTALEESSLKRVPTISLNSNYGLSNIDLSTYKVGGDYNFNKKETRNNLFFLLLSSVIKKAEVLRKKQTQKHFLRKKPKPINKREKLINYK